MSFDFSQHTAIFGGSFNPPHRGHVEAVKGLFEDPRPAKVWVVPSYGTPLKEVGVSYDDRLAMTQIAFHEVSKPLPIVVSDIEKKIQSQFTWQLLQELQTTAPKRAFVMGTDQLEQIEKWARFPDVLGQADWIVLIRKPQTVESIAPILKKYISSELLKPAGDDFNFKWSKGTHLRLVPTNAPEISATDLRGAFALRKTDRIKEQLPNGVYEYLEGKKLYGI